MGMVRGFVILTPCFTKHAYTQPSMDRFSKKKAPGTTYRYVSTALFSEVKARFSILRLVVLWRRGWRSERNMKLNRGRGLKFICKL